MAGYIGSKSSVTLVDGYTEAEADAEFVTKTGDSMTGGLTITTADNTNQLTIVSTDADASVGPALDLYRNSSSPADGDRLGSITLRGRNDNSQDVTYATIRAFASDVSDGTEDTEFELTTILAGTEVARMTTTGPETVFNQAGADIDFRVESDNLTHALFVQGSDGNVLVGKSATTFSSGGHVLWSDGLHDLTRAGKLIQCNRLSSDGDMISFFKDGTAVGSIGTGYGGDTQFGIQSNTGDLRFKAANNVVTWDGVQFYPAANGSKNIGHPNHRWQNIYATNGTIQTSDQTEKQDIASLTATEMLVAKRISALFKNYRWIDKVTVEGDDARTHTGVIAQEVQAAFNAEGLDASKYGLFCSDTWWEHGVNVPAVEADEDNEIEAVDAYTRTDTYDTEDEAPEGSTSKTRLGIRYPELLSFVAAYNEQRFASIEARLTALEA